MLRDLPFPVFIDVNEGVASLHLGTGSSHGEFVDTCVLSPVGTNDDVSRFNLTLWLQLKEVCEVVLDKREVGAWNVRYGRKKDSLFGVALGNLYGVFGSKSVVPLGEETANLILGDGLSGDNALGHDTGVVVADLPLIIFVDVDEGVATLYFLSGGSHCEFVDSNVCRSTVSIQG